MIAQRRGDPILGPAIYAGECLNDIVTRLRAAGCVFAEDEA